MDSHQVSSTLIKLVEITNHSQQWELLQYCINTKNNFWLDLLKTNALHWEKSNTEATVHYVRLEVHVE